MHTASPIKLRNGNWGARVTGTVNVGDEITITTRAGRNWQTLVERIVWSGTSRDGTPAAIVATVSAQRSAYGSGTCDECGTRRAVTTAVDLSGLRGRVCARCKRDEGMLSFG